MKPSVINLIYDGDCPVCQNYSRHLAIRQAAGSLQLMDARDDPPIMKEINARKINIDNGFVLNIGDEFYHGGDAIHALALLSTRAGPFNKLNFWIFRSRTLSKILYPLLKLCRSGLLLILGKGKLNNLSKRD